MSLLHAFNCPLIAPLAMYLCDGEKDSGRCGNLRRCGMRGERYLLLGLFPNGQWKSSIRFRQASRIP